MPHCRCAFSSYRKQGRGFSLIELLVVLAIVSLLAALLLPVFWTAQGKAREVSCASNLRQVGMGFALYLQDYDGRYPYAVDAIDSADPAHWASNPVFQALIPNLPQVHTVLRPYVGSPAIFRCPSDAGYYLSDFHAVSMNAFPSSYEKFGTSYGYRTELASRQVSESRLQKPAEVNLLLDIVGQWHGTLIPLAQRYNVLFADGHIKNLGRAQVDLVWANDIP